MRGNYRRILVHHMKCRPDIWPQPNQLETLGPHPEWERTPELPNSLHVQPLCGPLNTCQFGLFMVLACCGSTWDMHKIVHDFVWQHSSLAKKDRSARGGGGGGGHMSSNLWAAPMRMQQISEQPGSAQLQKCRLRNYVGEVGPKPLWRNFPLQLVN